MGFLSGDGDGGSTDLTDIGSTDSDDQQYTPDAGGYVPAPEPDTVEVNDSSGGGGSGSYTPTQPTGGEHTYDNDSGGQGWDGTTQDGSGSWFEMPELGLPEMPELPSFPPGPWIPGDEGDLDAWPEDWEPDFDGDGQPGGSFELPEFTMPELPELQVPDLPEFELPDLPEFDLSPPEGNIFPEGFMAGWADFFAGSTDEAVGARIGQLKKLVLAGVVGLAVLVFLQGRDSKA